MKRVFLSYNSKDRDEARRIARDLERAGYRVWFDQDELVAGDAIVDRIKEGLRDSDYLLVLLSKHSVRSKWVQHELSTAHRIFRSDVPGAIIPVRLDDAAVPEDLAGLKYVDFREDYEEGLNELLRVFAGTEEPDSPLSEVIDRTEFARAIAADLRPRLGIEFYVTTILVFLSVVAAALSAWPALEATFSRVPSSPWQKSLQALDRDSVTW